MAIELKGNDTSTYSDDVTISGNLSAAAGTFTGQVRGTGLRGYSLYVNDTGTNSGSSDVFRTYDSDGTTIQTRIKANGNLSVGNESITLNADGRVVANTSGNAHAFDRTVAENDTNTVVFFNANGNGNARVAASGKFVSKAIGGTQTWFAGGSTSNNNYEIKNSGGTGCKIVSGQNTWTTLSDERSKTSLVPITGGLEKIKGLRAVTGRYITDEEGVSRPFLIAQDVQAVLPEAVVEDSEGLNLNYDGVIPLLVSALQESKARIEALEAQLTQLTGGASS